MLTTLNSVQNSVKTFLKFKSYRNQLLQHVTEQDRETFATHPCCFFSRIDDDKLFQVKFVFIDETTSHLSRNVTQHNPRIWGSENPIAVTDHMRDNSNLNVFCAVSKNSTSCSGLFLCWISCDWCWLPEHVGTVGLNAYTVRRGSQWRAVSTRWGTSTFPLWSEELPTLAVSREMDMQGQVYHFAILFTWPNSFDFEGVVL